MVQVHDRIGDGLAYVLSHDFQEKAATEFRRWDKEWMRYLSIHQDYNFYFYDMDTPTYALRVTPQAIAAFSPEEMYNVKLLRSQAAQIWLGGEHVVDKTILEMGCGPGMLGRLASRFAKSYIGIDASKFALHIASLTSPSRCRYIHLGDVAAIRDLSGVADACVGRNFFIHHNLNDSLWILRFLRDLTKPGGLISADFYFKPELVGGDRRYTATDSLDPAHASALYNFSEADIRNIAVAAEVDLISTDAKPELERHFAIFRTRQAPGAGASA
jgi:SAM-dependent methyltransferase